MIPHLLTRKQTHFVLWRPGTVNPPPRLTIGTFQPGSPPTLANQQSLAMTQSALSNDLWEIAAADCNLTSGTVYHYWFELTDSAAYTDQHQIARVTDPTAFSVDWRLTFVFPSGYDPESGVHAESPLAVVHFANGKLAPSDPSAKPKTFTDSADVAMQTLPANQRLVIYELPTAWTKAGDLLNASNVGVGTFRDVLALVEKTHPGAHFANVPAVGAGQHLIDLGVNALELLPPADSFYDRKSWGYGTTNYFTPDWDLGRPLDASATPAVNAAKASTAVSDFLNLVRACHEHGIRFFYDAVMAFSKHDPYRFAGFLDFHVDFSSGDPEKIGREGFGGDLWKYVWNPIAYDPITGVAGGTPFLARRHMITHLLHWMSFYHVDGLRLDSVNNYKNWDFAGEIRDISRQAWNDRWTAEGNAAGGADERFLVVGEELSVPKELLNKLDALWNERFKQILRKVILGQNADGEATFEGSVRKLIDCRNLDLFSRGYQAINYIGSHDVGGMSNERFYNYLHNNGVTLKEKQIKLAFVCLLTAVGIPMILAGDEFGERSNFEQVNDSNKEIDPINFEHVQDRWRADVFKYVSRLVKFRTKSDALSVDDTDFIHVDFNDGKRVLAWKRGRAGIDDPVIVVANFSDWGTADPANPNALYDVSTFPSAPQGRQWQEITHNRAAPRAGNEPIFPWEAKVYALD